MAGLKAILSMELCVLTSWHCAQMEACMASMSCMALRNSRWAKSRMAGRHAPSNTSQVPKAGRQTQQHVVQVGNQVPRAGRQAQQHVVQVGNQVVQQVLPPRVCSRGSSSSSSRQSLSHAEAAAHGGRLKDIVGLGGTSPSSQHAAHNEAARGNELVDHGMQQQQQEEDDQAGGGGSMSRSLQSLLGLSKAAAAAAAAAGGHDNHEHCTMDGVYVPPVAGTNFLAIEVCGKVYVCERVCVCENMCAGLLLSRGWRDVHCYPVVPYLLDTVGSTPWSCLFIPQRETTWWHKVPYGCLMCLAELLLDSACVRAGTHSYTGRGAEGGAGALCTAVVRSAPQVMTAQFNLTDSWPTERSAPVRSKNRSRSCSQAPSVMQVSLYGDRKWYAAAIRATPMFCFEDYGLQIRLRIVYLLQAHAHASCRTLHCYESLCHMCWPCVSSAALAFAAC
eukprot:1161801-Pelagomonas_calceolata.AAC.8